MPKKYTYQPDYAVAPGVTLKETLEEKGLSQTDLAMRMEMTDKTISQIINGIAPISYETANKLEMVIGIPSQFWNAAEARYRETLMQQEEQSRLAENVEWLEEIPVRELIDRNYIQSNKDKATLLRGVLKFFGVTSVEAWKNAWGQPVAQFRGADAIGKRPGYIAAWLRMGEIQSEAIECKPFDPRAFKQALVEVRKLTITPATCWASKIAEICADAGVAVVFTKEIPNAGVSGAVRWISKDKALIQLSLKYKTDDQLWFTFFHEAGHILRHGKKHLFLEFGLQSDTDEENQANEFARDILIPPEYTSTLYQLRSKAMIVDFAKSIDLAPGIVVGRMQREKIIDYSYFNNLKRKLMWIK
jgi:HTH-type transcriptional regulator / antitoxin HigA